MFLSKIKGLNTAQPHHSCVEGWMVGMFYSYGKEMASYIADTVYFTLLSVLGPGFARERDVLPSIRPFHCESKASKRVTASASDE